jgi:N-acetyl sugar amidotransferase
VTAVETQNNAARPSLRVQVCTRTVMDTTDPDIVFDENGVCNYCQEFEALTRTLPSVEERDRQFAAMIEQIKTAGRGKKYDSLIGLSGGVDSSYLAWLAKRHGLRPLAVHFDNGWNTELAVSNIESLVTKLGYDLETFVMDWDEFRDLQRAYFKASVIDLEVPTDHMIFGALHQIAARRGIRTILSGSNFQTEWLLPKTWYYRKSDLRNIRCIHRKFGSVQTQKLPGMGVWRQAYYHYVKGIRTEAPLNLIDYDKAAAKRFLMEELQWRDYGGKHHESVFTRFYQGYILPNKFDVDKRKAHLSNLILMGQISREDALRELQQPTYDEETQAQDKVYVAKKLGFSTHEFEQVLSQANIPHEAYGTDVDDRKLYARLVGAASQMRKIFGGRS